MSEARPSSPEGLEPWLFLRLRNLSLALGFGISKDKSPPTCGHSASSANQHVCLWTLGCQARGFTSKMQRLSSSRSLKLKLQMPLKPNRNFSKMSRCSTYQRRSAPLSSTPERCRALGLPSAHVAKPQNGVEQLLAKAAKALA